MSDIPKDIRLIAYYLPQFHPFPENDQWWGKGFTEWTNVTRATPLFVGHYQPHLPADLGFYDLRLREIQREQVALARAHGIDAFCYHYYWFSGKRLMERPLDAMLADPGIDMPFCLCWANENWTRRWDAREHEVLIRQRYSPEDPVASLHAMLPYLRDPRYLTHNGRKVIVVYRPQQFPDSKAWVAAWRSGAEALGLGELHLVCALTHGNWSYKSVGFDAGVEFPPHSIGHEFNTHISKLGFFKKFRGQVPDMQDVAEAYLERDRSAEPNVYRCVYPSWDNTARRGELAMVTLNGTPENYEYWLHQAIEATRRDTGGKDGLVFINAWNEWAEGCHLEPDRRYGSAFLQATLRAKRGSKLTGWTHVGVPSEAGPEAQAQHVKAFATLQTMRQNHHKSPVRRAVHGLRDTLRVLRGKNVH
jgi:lipopolysaccharide biosynthesis protein